MDEISAKENIKAYYSSYDEESRFSRRFNAVESVSYTHLDVYKRQAYELRSGSDQKCLAETAEIIDAAFEKIAASDTDAVFKMCIRDSICRSPMAEFIFKDMAQKAGVANEYYIASAATSSEEIWGCLLYTSSVKSRTQRKCQNRIQSLYQIFHIS